MSARTAQFVITVGTITVGISETPNGDGENTYGWDVSNGKRHLCSGVSIRSTLREALTDLAARTATPSARAASFLRSIPGQASPAHVAVPAADLRDGDLLRIGYSTNYVLVSHVVPAEGDTVRVHLRDVDTDHGGLIFAATDLCNLSMRAVPAAA